jgi:hypothetical protein
MPETVSIPPGRAGILDKPAQADYRTLLPDGSAHPVVAGAGRR